MRKLIIALVVLAALFVAVDRVVVSAAENVVARRVQVAADLEQEPQVEIRGFPFLTQAVRGLYRRVDISLDGLQRGDARLESLVVHLKDVHAPLAQMLNRDDSIRVRAESAKASAVVPYHVIEQRIPGEAQVKARGERLRLTTAVTRFGQEFAAEVVLQPSISDGNLVFSAQRIQVEGVGVTDELAERFDFTVEIGRLPFGLHLTGVEARPGGVRLAAVGKDVLLTGPDAAQSLPAARVGSTG